MWHIIGKVLDEVWTGSRRITNKTNITVNSGDNVDDNDNNNDNNSDNDNERNEKHFIFKFPDRNTHILYLLQSPL